MCVCSRMIKLAFKRRIVNIIGFINQRCQSFQFKCTCRKGNNPSSRVLNSSASEKKLFHHKTCLEESFSIFPPWPKG